MTKNTIAPVIVLLMLIAAGGYMMLNNDGNDSNAPGDGDGNNQTGDEWDVYYVQSESDLPSCWLETWGLLYYVADTAGFETCTEAGWVFVDLTGQAGTNGTNGTNGTSGAAGHSALVRTTLAPAGTNDDCEGDGIMIEVGVDDNDDGVLQPSEVEKTQYVCDGADGKIGSASQNTMLTSISTPTLQACSSGGRIVQQGLDNGDGGGIAQNGVLESSEVDYTTTYCSNFLVTRLADIRSGSSSGTAEITVMGTRLYFTADDGITGRELWAHETTNHSSWQVANIFRSGTNWNGSGGVYYLTAMGTRLYFSANDGVRYGHELWAHETTNSSTWQVAELWSNSSSGSVGWITAMGTRLYFTADDGISGYELWAHETTNDSTWQVADINSGSGGSNPYGGRNATFTVMGTRLYFRATDGITGYELWAHEATNDSTWQVADINSGSGDSNPWLTHTPMGTRLYFRATDGITGYELWAHEATNDSTWQVADINSGAGSGVLEITAMGTRLYLSADDGITGWELWAHETTNSSTWQVADINSGNSESWSNPSQFTPMGTRFYFKASDGITGYELWAHDTTNDSTWQVADINSGSNSSSPSWIKAMGTRLYFRANDGIIGSELHMMEIEHTITYN
jgi:ELWxxDGT repeat protein